jgi:ketosteroid isomerase-like protein
MAQESAEFDYAAYKDAFERKDSQRWAQFYADDAEWIEDGKIVRQVDVEAWD